MASFVQSLDPYWLSVKDLIALTYTDKEIAAIARKRLNKIRTAFDGVTVRIDIEFISGGTNEWFVPKWLIINRPRLPATLGELFNLDDKKYDRVKSIVGNPPTIKDHEPYTGSRTIYRTSLTGRCSLNGHIYRPSNFSFGAKYPSNYPRSTSTDESDSKNAVVFQTKDNYLMSGSKSLDSNLFYDVARIMASNRTIALGLQKIVTNIVPREGYEFNVAYVRGEQDGRTVKLIDAEIANILTGIPTYVTVKKVTNKDGTETYVPIGRPEL